MRSLIYWHPLLYQMTIRLLYGRHYRARYAELATRIAAGSNVVDLCCGDCRLFTQELRGVVKTYLGLDLNQGFVQWATRRGIPAQVWDFRVDPVPTADVIVLQGSLYQAIPLHGELLHRMLRAARQTVLIAEPVRNHSTGRSSLIASVAQYMAHPGTHHMRERFNELSLKAEFRRFPLVDCFSIAGGREFLGIFDARAHRA